MTVSGGDLLPVLSDAISEVTEVTPDAVQIIKQSIDNDTLNAIADKLEVCCFLYNKNTNYCRGQSSKLQREFPYYCRALFGIFLSLQFLWI